MNENGHQLKKHTGKILYVLSIFLVFHFICSPASFGVGFNESVKGAEKQVNTDATEEQMTEDLSVTTAQSACDDISTEMSTAKEQETVQVEPDTDGGIVLEPVTEKSTDTEVAATEEMTNTTSEYIGEEVEETPIINVVLPGEFDLTLDPYGINSDNPDNQISSPVYEIINYGSQDVVVSVKPSIISKGFEWKEKPPEKGTDLTSSDIKKGKAVYLAMRVADSGKKRNIENGKYTFRNAEYDQVVSKKESDCYNFLLRGTDAEGNVVTEGKSAFRFVGNLDPKGEYQDGELKIEVVFSLSILDENEVDQMKKEEITDKLNFIPEEMD